MEQEIVVVLGLLVDHGAHFGKGLGFQGEPGHGSSGNHLEGFDFKRKMNIPKLEKELGVEAVTGGGGEEVEGVPFGFKGGGGGGEELAYMGKYRKGSLVIEGGGG